MTFGNICNLDAKGVGVSTQCIQSIPCRIILILSTIAFSVLGLLSCQGKLPNATVSYFLGSSFFVAAAIFSSFLASSFCIGKK